jgi:hypothetical protein
MKKEKHDRRLHKMRFMKRIFVKFEAVMAAASFAEAGEFETARHILKKDRARITERASIQDYRRPVARKELRAD